MTLIDMMVTTAIMAIIAATVIPVTSSNARTITLAATRQLIADIQYAQLRSITQPSNPTRVVIAQGGGSYWLAEADTPNTPIALPEGAVGAGDPYKVVFGGYRGVNLDGVTVAFTNKEYSVLVFDEYGRLTSAGNVPLRVAFGSSEINLSVNALTGTITTE